MTATGTGNRGMRQFLVLFFHEEDENAEFWSIREYLCVTAAIIYGRFRGCEYLHDPQNRLYPEVAQTTKLSSRSKFVLPYIINESKLWDKLLVKIGLIYINITDILMFTDILILSSK